MFITFEGPEGAGKSTLIRSLAVALESKGIRTLVTREPGAGEFGKQVRKLLLEGEDVAPLAELFLFLADRAQHVAKLIEPALLQGIWVLCDRHADSTVVYQGYGRGLDIVELRMLNSKATRGRKPDLTFLLDLPVEIGLGRITQPDRLDREPLEFHQRIRGGFLAESRIEPNRWVILDAMQSPADVLASALRHLQQRQLSSCSD